jgi:hypothetical protein
LADLAARIGQQLGAQTAKPITVTHPFEPVTRLRVLVTLVKLGLVGEGTVSLPDGPSARMPPDAALIPAWGVPYVAAAVEQGWWPIDRPLNAREVATWTFVKVVIPRMVGSAPETETVAIIPAPHTDSPPPAAADGAAGSYTGLILDARGLDVQRAMGPRIVDEDGEVLYPDPRHVPEKSYLEDHGMAAYASSAEEAPRSGSHPLLVQAIRAAGPGHDDLVISRETARQIREANQQSGFLSRWAVSILIGSH